MLSKYRVKTYQGNELIRNSSGYAPQQSSQLAEPLWSNAGLMSGIGVREVDFHLKKKKNFTWERSVEPFPKILICEGKATTNNNIRKTHHIFLTVVFASAS